MCRRVPRRRVWTRCVKRSRGLLQKSTSALRFGRARRSASPGALAGAGAGACAGTGAGTLGTGAGAGGTGGASGSGAAPVPVHAQVKAPDERRLLHAQLERWRLVGVTGMAGLTRWCDRQPPRPPPPPAPSSRSGNNSLCAIGCYGRSGSVLLPSSGGTRAVFVRSGACPMRRSPPLRTRRGVRRSAR